MTNESTSTPSESRGLAIAGDPLESTGTWWFLASEATVFGGLVIALAVSSALHGGFAEQAAEVNWRIGALETLVLVVSSVTILLAHGAVCDGDREGARTALAATVALELAFLSLAALDGWKLVAAGLTPPRNLFWLLHSLLTGLHGAHVVLGLVIHAALLAAASRPRGWAEVESRIHLAVLYWLVVVVVWALFFPLLHLA